jgi:glycosyltransferase involved in cell wall biosynthesis
MEKNKPIVDVVIPAMNEESSIGLVIEEIPLDWVRFVVVADNASKDRTAAVAEEAGAIVVREERKGYGQACLTAIERIQQNDPLPDILVFIDGDLSDYPEELPQVIAPIIKGQADLVIGSRALGDREKGSMTFPQIFGNALATKLLRWIYGVRFSDLGPFRAIDFDRYLSLEMEDKNYGWTVEMQLKAAKKGLRCTEVPVRYRRRIGKSKVSGTVKGAIMAGYKILWTIFKYM